MGKIIIDGIEYGGCVDTTNFTSSDVADADATSWTSVTPIVDDEPNVSLFTKLSQIAKNVRYLYKTLRNTDLSVIWTNSDTTQTFNSQNVSISNLSDYDYFVVEFRTTKNRDTYETIMCMPNTYMVKFSSTSVIIGRGFTVDTSNGYISFGNGFTRTTYGSATETATGDVLIPSRIFGRKCL